MLKELVRTPSIQSPYVTEEEFVSQRDEDIKAEWVDGEVIVAAAATTKHVLLVTFLHRTFGFFVEVKGLGVAYGPELEIRLGKLRRRRVPDLLFVAADRLEIVKESHVEGAPDLIVEIVSQDSVARDWRDKYMEYEAAGVQEYWVIDPLSKRVEAYKLGKNGQFTRILEKQKTIYSAVLPGFYLKPEWLWQPQLPNPLDILKEWGVI